MRRSALAFMLTLLAGFAAPPARALTEEEVSKQLKCQCGCGYPDLHSCACGEWAVPAKSEIRARIARGEDLQTILKYFVDRHGEIVLTAPVQEGFNRAEWIVPSVLILVAGGLVAVAVVRWKRRDGRGPVDDDEVPPTADARGGPDRAYLDRLHEEIYGSKES